MLTINLLPEETRENIDYSKRNKKLLGNIYVLITLCLLLLVAFGISFFFLEKNNTLFKDIIAENEQAAAKYDETLANAKALDERTKMIKKIKSDYRYWSKLNAIIWDLTPESVYLMSVDVSEDVLKLNGTARTKTDVAGFYENLLKSNGFDYEIIEKVTNVSDTENFNLQMYLAKPAFTKEELKNEE